MSVHTLLLLSSMHSLGLGLDLGNRLDQREKKSPSVLIHESQSFRKKKRRFILNDTQKIYLRSIINSFFLTGNSKLTSQGHTQKFLKGGLNFSKSNQYPIVVNLVIVKQGFAGIVVSLQHLLIQKIVIMILKVVGCEDCTQDYNLPLWGLGGKAPSR